jgi:hypothetical protein
VTRAARPIAPPSRDTVPRGASAAVDRVLRTCPVCGKELSEQKCKLRCPDPRCGYFLSCADFY